MVRRILNALSSEAEHVEDRDNTDFRETITPITPSSGLPPSAIIGTKIPKYNSYRARLEPLFELEDRLIRLLSSPDGDEPTHLPSSPNQQVHGQSGRRSVMNWKIAFPLGGKSKSPKSAYTREIEGWWEDPDDPVHTLHAAAPAMLELWRDEAVRSQLREKKIWIEESSGL